MPLSASTHTFFAQKMEPLTKASILLSSARTGAPPCFRGRRNMGRCRISRLTGLSNFNVIVANKELRRALVGAADNRQQARYLPPRDEPQRAAFRAGEHGPI